MSTVRYGADVQAARATPEVPPVTTDRRRRRGEDTRARIMSAAAELFAAQGFDATSTQAIAAASGITVAAIYRHVPSKADLLVAVARHALETTFTETMTDVGPATRSAADLRHRRRLHRAPTRVHSTPRRRAHPRRSAAPRGRQLAAALPPTRAAAHRRPRRGWPARRLPRIRCRRHSGRARCPAADHGHLQHRRPRPGRPRSTPTGVAPSAAPSTPRSGPGLGLSRSNGEAARSADALAAAPPHSDSQFADGAAHDPARRSLAALSVVAA